MKKIVLLSLLLVAALFMQNANATLTYLPFSSHYQGTSYYNNDGVAARVEFAVYDTLGGNGNEWADSTGFASPGDGRYIYAYQIFNDVGSAAIEGFTFWADDHHELIISGMGNQDPEEADYIFALGFVEPTGMGTNNDGTEAWWEFEGGILVAGENSWFLIFSSSSNWTTGDYRMDSVEDNIPVPNPEPCTLALLGIGSTILLAKRRNAVNSH